ncbi:MAG TPA: M81 family metallopeptidase, partial [Abditibacteriaceae bacterium]|nr:M81 family metallopeptidase [Abditibacteriaceae bacterium]
MKAILAQFLYESNTFCPQRAGMEIFKQVGAWCVGAAAVRAWAAGGDSQMRGSLDVLESAGWQTAPVFVALCGAPSGRLSRECFDEIRRTMLQQIGAALPADVLILHLHGAACAEDEDDVEGALIEMARCELGFKGRLVVSLDLHANITRRMAQWVNAITAYRTMPHMDFYETGRRAARLAMQTRITQRAVAKIAALIPPTDTDHCRGRFAHMQAKARAAEESDDIDDVSLLPVQPWLDVAEPGSAVLVTGRGPRVAQVAHELADEWYAQRGDWQTGLMSWNAILKKLKTKGEYPWILVDTADAVTGGSPGSSAEALRQLLPCANSLPGPVLLCVVDAATVEAARGGSTHFTVGCPAVPLHAAVTFIGEGSYRASGNAYHGARFSMCGAAVLQCGQLFIVASCQPIIAVDAAYYECVGLNPNAALAVQSKSMMGWRANFNAESGRGLLFDGPGATSLHFARLPYTGERRELFPIESNPREPIKLWQSN